MFPIDKTDEWDSMHDPDSMAQPSPLRYVPSITTNGTVTPEMRETCHLADIPGHDCAVDPCEPPSVSEMSETKIPDDLVNMYESSKLDTTMFVGSQVRQLIGRISAAEANLRNGEAMYIAMRDRCARVEQDLNAAESREKELQEQLRDEALAFNHADEIVGKLEVENASLRSQLAEITKPLTQEDVFAFSLDTLDPKESIPLLLAARAAKGGE